jgi:hypothetical protein
MIKANKLPDVIGPFENADALGDHDRKFVNYVHQRHVTTAIKRTLDDVLEACTALLYEHSTMRTTHHLRMVMQRFESLVLGYQYPHLSEDRPRMHRYRDESDVIQFLFRNKEYILETCKPLKKSQTTSDESDSGSNVSRASDSGSNVSTADTAEKSKRGPAPRISQLDESIKWSPLFKKVVDLASSEKEKERKEADTLVEKLYAAWEKTQNGSGGDGNGPESDSRFGITEIILQTLLPTRYEAFNDKSATKRNVNRLKQQYTFLCDVIGSLNSFADFVKDHGDKLAGGVDMESKLDLFPDEWQTPDPESLQTDRDRCKNDAPPKSWGTKEPHSMSKEDAKEDEDDILGEVVISRK